jgi:HK97 family phage prohead protease
MPTVGRHASKDGHTQSVIFYKEANWTKESSRKWCKNHDYYTDGFDENDTQFRWRQYDPQDDKFDYRNRVIEKKDGKPSIMLVLGYLKEKKSMPTNDLIERRCLSAGELRVAKNDGGQDVIEGQAAVFNQYSEDLGGWIEIIEPGFFDDVLTGDTRALQNHDTNYVLGRTTNKTLELAQDEKGLNDRIYPPDTSWARDLLVSLRRGDITQQSFSFRVNHLSSGDEVDGDEWYILGDKIVRRLKQGGCKELYDVSPVTFPAFPQTSVSADTRSRFEEFRTKNAGTFGPDPQTALPGGAPAPDPEPDDDDAARQQALLANRRRRLELAEKS